MRASAFLVGGPFGRLVIADRHPVAIPPASSLEWNALEEDAARQTRQLARAAALVLLGFIAVWWPLDLLVNHRDPAVQAIFTTWRIGELAIFSAMYFALSSWSV